MASELNSTAQYEALDTDDHEAPSVDKPVPVDSQDQSPDPDNKEEDPNVDIRQPLNQEEGEEEEAVQKTCCWIGKTDLLIYSSQALSAWGDRMWTFAVALFLVELEDNSLRLTATFGFALSISVLVLGAMVGKWVDKTPRLKATQYSLLVQNSFVIVCAIILLFLLKYKDIILKEWYPGLFLLCLTVILLGVIANLASLAQKICIQKDWVVVLAGDDREILAKLNAGIRRIDLSVNILAPIVVGLIMNFASMTIAALFIAGWNVVSVIVEYNLLLRVYKIVPALAMKGDLGEPSEETLNHDADVNKSKSSQDGDTETSSQDQGNSDKSTPKTSSNWFVSTYEAWKTYRSYTVSWAGMGIALFYMTVMGFDSITSGYGYTIGVPEYMIGVMRALGSIAGIIGTLVFPVLHRKVGLERTGLYAISFDILCLTLCVASIWAPGSPFDWKYYHRTGEPIPSQDNTPFSYNVLPYTVQNDIADGTSPFENGDGVLELTNSTDVVTEYISETMTSTFITTAPVQNFTYINSTNTTTEPRTLGGKACMDYIGVETNYWTAALFFGGMIMSRIGLWTFDLVVTQSIQESIRESERGVFNGVQRSLECSMDMIHFILVIVLPCPATFGYLIILSVAFVIAGSLLFSFYSYKIRGHLFHTEKLPHICGTPNGGVNLRQDNAGPA